MSKKTNAAKQQTTQRRRRAHRRHPKGLRPNPAAFGILSEQALISIAESAAFGEIGCTLLRALGVKPIDLLKGGATIEVEE